MILLETLPLQHRGEARQVELYQGDLATLDAAHAVDVLVVSAYRNDYFATATSLIGALQRAGVSVAQLSRHKALDLRDEFGCWLSGPTGASGFKRLLCVESGWQGEPPQLADQVFRALAPISVTNTDTRTVAMPLIGTGDQGYPADQMLDAILRAAVAWFRRGMPVETLKIVMHRESDARFAIDSLNRQPSARDLLGPSPDTSGWDVFLSYAGEDLSTAERIHDDLASGERPLRVFRDRPALKHGSSWLMQLAEAIDSARCFIALYSPDYWNSVYCKDEFSAAYVRQSSTGQRLLFPIYFRDVALPSFFQALHYQDCREADAQKLALACAKVREHLRR